VQEVRGKFVKELRSRMANTREEEKTEKEKRERT
jgi:hypothetical protein